MLELTQIKGRIYCNTLDSSWLVNNYWAIVLNVKLNFKNMNNKRYIIILNPGQKFSQDFCRGGQKLSHHFTTLDESSPYNCYPRHRFPGHSFPYYYQPSTVHSTMLIHWIKLDDVTWRLLRPCLLRVLWCSVCFCTGHFVMVPINLTCSHCLQNFFFEHLLHLYYK